MEVDNEYIKPASDSSISNLMSNIFDSDNEKKLICRLTKKQRSLSYLHPGLFPMNFIQKHFICRICRDILNNPANCTECNENFCEECLNEFLKKNKFCINSCYLKDTLNNSFPGKIVKTHSSVINLLEKLSFNCMFNKKDTITYIAVERHIKSNCKDRPYICPFEGCTFEGGKEKISVHAEECDMRKLYCPVCKTFYNIKDSANHNCGEFFIEKYNRTKERFKEMIEKYEIKLGEIEALTSYVEKNIKINKSY